MTPEQIEANEAILYKLELAKDSPAKAWWNLNAAHPAKYRALKVDPADWTSSYACAPFRFARIDGQARIIAAWPCPVIFGEYNLDWLDIETVIEWSPVTNTVVIQNEAVPQIVGAFDGTEKGTIYANPFAFFRNWVEQRAQFITRYKTCRDAHWLTPPIERDYPGVLMVGSADKIVWRAGELPELIEVVGANPDDIFKSIFRAARLPKVIGRNHLRRAA